MKNNNNNKTMHKARKAGKNEFYTRLCDIELELANYDAEHFKDKTIYCNCDDPKESNFWKYFSEHFDNLELKKLISTHYEQGSKSYKLEMYKDIHGNKNIITSELNGDGDFRSDESIELLKEADIVVTNPPFSLFREYIAQLMQYDKQFIIIGNINAITYKEVFPLLKDNKIWIGCTNFNLGMYFYVPEDFKYTEAYKGKKEIDGKKVNRVPGCCWYTNIDIAKRHEEINTWKKYTPEDYPKYDNYDAIEVKYISDIPVDYEGEMGVPITFMDKYCPEQFEIIDINPHFFSRVEKGLEKPKQLTFNIKGKKDPYARILIKRKQ